MAKRKDRSEQGMPPGFTQEKESMFAAVAEAMREMNSANPEEAQAFLDQFTGRKMSDITAELAGDDEEWTRQERAEDLFFEAMEARTTAALRKKLKKVLEINPNHVRALTALAMSEKKVEDVEKGLRHAIATGERNLGPLMEEGHGQLWGFIEARPYMEARAELAQFLAGQENRLDEAITEHQEILRLNESDNQGLRDPLLGLLMEEKRFDEARALVKRYDTDYAATWMYAKAMLEFQFRAEQAKWDTGGHDAEWLEKQIKTMAVGLTPEIPKSVRQADRTLIKALKFNPWCALYLINAGEYIQKELPAYYSPGSEDEARLYLVHHGAAWVKNPGALVWLMMVAMPWLLKNGFGKEIEPG